MRLKEIRKSKGISQLKMAIDLNTNQNTISRYETGEREPGINELIQIADYFNISIDYLLERTDIPEVNKWSNMHNSPKDLFYDYFCSYCNSTIA